MFPYHYADEKYGTAVSTLATSAAPIQRRLEGAYLSFHPMREENLPDEGMWAEHQSILEALTSAREGAGDGHLQMTLNAMSDEDAERLAERIFNLWDLIRERVAEQRNP